MVNWFLKKSCRDVNIRGQRVAVSLQYEEIPHNMGGSLAGDFQPSAACKFLDLPPGLASPFDVGLRPVLTENSPQESFPGARTTENSSLNCFPGARTQ